MVPVVGSVNRSIGAHSINQTNKNKLALYNELLSFQQLFKTVVHK